MALKSIASLLLLIYYLSRCEALDETSVREYNYWRCPLPKCKTCPSPRQLEQPGIGFALEMGYGYLHLGERMCNTQLMHASTAAVRWHNGTLQPLIRVSGSLAYLELMKKLSYTSAQTRFPDSISTIDGKAQYVISRLQRIINKLLGRLANQQAAIIDGMLAQLKVAVEEVLPPGIRTTHAVVSSLDSISLTLQEVGDALDYLQITNLITGPDELYSVSSAYAGFGFGLCKSYTQPHTCDWEEEFELPYERVLVVDFSEAALIMTVKGMKSSTKFSSGAAIINPELGFTEGKSDEEIQRLFREVTARIRRFVQDYRAEVTLIILTGTKAGDGRFIKAVKDAVEDLVTSQAIAKLDSFLADANADMNRVFATAKGAAEVAKRRLEGPVRCIWREECKSLPEARPANIGREKLEL
jgi:hypothetical protein